MGPYVFFYAALIGFFAFAAIYHFVLWSASRRERLLAVFSFDCVVRAALCGAILRLITATDPAETQNVVRIRIALVLLTMVASLWCVRFVSGVRANRFVGTLTAALLLVFLIHTIVRPLNGPIIAIQRSVLPWGETISTPLTGPPGWWVAPVLALAYLVQFFGLYCGAKLWLRDRVAGALILSATCGTMLILTLEAMRTFHVFIAPVLGAFPHVLWVGAIALLIARGRRQTQDQLAASEQRFRGIFDQTFQFIGLLRTDGVLIEVNRTALEFAKMREADVLGKSFWETPWWTHSPELQQRLRGAIRAAAEGEMVRFEATHPRPGGALAYVDFSLKPIRDEEGQVVLLIPEGRDITERKESEEKQRALEAQLAQVHKMEAIGQLAGGVAHDFNNLLTVINGACDLLLATTSPDDSRHALATDILDAGERAASLTRQLLTFSRRQVVEPRLLDLNSVVAETERLLRRLIGEDIRLETKLHPAPARVKADPGQLGQVIVNLAVNVRDAMPTGGTLTIRIDDIEIDGAAAAAYGDAKPGRYVVLAVADTGGGMPPEVQARIFEPFFTTKGPSKGTGLGLATVRTIAEESGGFLSVSSEPGRGSEFRLFLPALDEPAKVSGGKSGAAPTPGGAETILLVEDDDAVRTMTRRMLGQFGYVVLEASGGAKAIQLAESHTGPIHLLVTDVVMPEMGGRELVERMKTIRPGLNVLYLSGYADDQVVRHGVRQAETAFLQKPFTIDALAGKVRQLIDAADNPKAS